MPYYINPNNEGLKIATSVGDGYSIYLKWNQAYPKTKTNKVAYHIFMASKPENVFSEGVKFVSTDGYIDANVSGLEPGQLYHFAVRAVEYNPILFDPTELSSVDGYLRSYPESLLRSNITISDTLIPLAVGDGSFFPTKGMVKIGVELVYYSSVDIINDNLQLLNSSYRGYDNSTAYSHDTDGYDGYTIWENKISFLLGREEQNTTVFPCQCSFQFNNYQFTDADGYHQVLKDLLNTDLMAADEANTGFPAYDYAGWHRTNPVDILTGMCVGSYIGGEQYCADGYDGVGRVVRGSNMQEQNEQRQEMLLNMTGEPVVLVKRSHTGITCKCYQPATQYPEDRCQFCHGTGFVLGYEQFFNPRRSDGRILVRFSPVDEDIKMHEAGLEAEYVVDCWTLTVPTLKDRDIIIRFDQDGNEEFRYEVISVNRNKTLVGLQGMQKFRAQRIRKFDPAYRISAFRNTADLPNKLSTGFNIGGNLLPHKHTITITNQSSSNFGQLTSVDQGHNHNVKWDGSQLVVDEVLGHTHNIILP